MTKEERRRLLKELRETDRQRAIDDLPAPLQHLERIVASVDLLIRGGRGCAHDLTTTRECVEEYGLRWVDVERWLHAHGGHCDCEVVMNVGNHCREVTVWIEATKRRV